MKTDSFRDLRVGETFDEFRGKPEALYFFADQNGYTALANMSAPTEQERSQMEQGKPFRMCMTTVDDVIFLEFRFDRHWMDAPFDPHLCAGTKILKKPVGDAGSLLNLILVDSDTAEVLILRDIELSHDFSLTLYNEIMRTYKLPFSRKRYDDILHTTYQTYSTQALAYKAAAQFTLGK